MLTMLTYQNAYDFLGESGNSIDFDGRFILGLKLSYFLMVTFRKKTCF